jgi:hypothetical protein
MKTQTIILSLCFSLSTFADDTNTSWGRTNFWQAPQVKAMKVKMLSADKELERNCTSYKSLVASALRASAPVAARSIAMYRTTPLSTDARYKGKFLVSGLRGFYRIAVNSAIDSSTIDVTKDFMPNYTIANSTTEALLTSVKDLKIDAVAGSLTDISRKLGLPDVAVSLSQQGPDMFLVIEGRDMACDLLENKLVIKSPAKAEVSISQEDYINLNELYQNQIAPEMTQVLNLKEGDALKAARLGFRLGNIFERNQNSVKPEAVEKQIKGFMEKSFKESSLEVRPEMISRDGNKVNFNLSGRLESTVDLTFSL